MILYTFADLMEWPQWIVMYNTYITLPFNESTRASAYYESNFNDVINASRLNKLTKIFAKDSSSIFYFSLV